MDLAVHKESVTVPVRNKLSYYTNSDRTWKIMDLNFGNMEEVRAQLKQKILNIKLKAIEASSRIIELFNSLQYKAAKIDTAGETDLLKSDQENKYYVPVRKNTRH